MPNDFYTQQALADDPRFRKRVKSALGLVAWAVLTEDPGITGHNGRAAYARQVLANLDAAAAGVAGWLVMRTNVMSFATTCTIDQGITTVVTASGDADLQSQLTADWSNLAGA